MPTATDYLTWTAPQPTEAKDCGYHLLSGVELFHLTRGLHGPMNHLPGLARVQDRFWVLHTHHPLNTHESTRGRNVCAWASNEAGTEWAGPFELMPPLDDVTNELLNELDGTHPVGFPAGVREASDGHVYGLCRIGVKQWENKGPIPAVASHYTAGWCARRLSPAGPTGAAFWIDRNDQWPLDHAARMEDLSESPLSAELMSKKDVPLNGIPPPVLPRFEPIVDGVALVEPTTVPLGDGRAICLARSQNGCGIFHSYVSVSSDGGNSWGPFEKTNLPNGENMSSLLRLSDDRMVLAGSLANRDRANRCPLAVAIAEDGRHFDSVHALLVDRIHIVARIEEYDGALWLATSHGGRNQGRADVIVVRIPIDTL